MLHYLRYWVLAAVMLSGCWPKDNDNATDAADKSLQHLHDLSDTIRHVLQGENLSAPLPIVNRAHYHTIEIKQMKFNPQELSVDEGDTIVWVNNGITAHDVTEVPGGKWASTSMPVGSSWQMIARETADYYCSIHVVMKGKLVVK